MTGAAGFPVGVVVPIRSFAGGKSRLAAVLDDGRRERLLRTMADRVVAAAQPWPVVIVSSAPEVADWAAGIGLHCLADPGTLDTAAEEGLSYHRHRGAARVAVVHADLPRIETLAPVAEPGDRVAVVVPCHRDDGTPVLSVPTGAPFRFRYGPGSFVRHVAEARRLDLQVRIVRDPALRHDVDEPADLEGLVLEDLLVT